MSLNPDPKLAAQLLVRWCPSGKEVLVIVQPRTLAAHVYTQLPGTQVMLPISVQVADLLDRYLDRDGAVRLERKETAEGLLARLSTVLHGDPTWLILGNPPSSPSPPPPPRRRRLAP